MSRTALVGAALAVKPGNGGNAWSRLSLVEGLRRLGFDAILVEELPDATDEQAAYFRDVCRTFGVVGWLVDGVAPAELRDRAGDAELLLNVGGHITDDALLRGPRVRVYLDDDPGYTQFWHAQGLLGDRIERHDFHFTFGENIGRPGCPIPTSGIEWRRTRPAVVLDDWPVVSGGPAGVFTTVASWRGAYGRVEHEGRVFGQKAHEFRRFADLPRRAPQRFELALQIDAADSADADLLRDAGWILVDPREVGGSPEAFRAYVQRSWAEFSVAQGIYVETGSGWFSDRTTRYLASGKPVLVQDTGFGSFLPAGEGLVTFTTIDEAVEGAAHIARDYEHHAAAARAVAEEHFDSDRVLGRMLEDIGL